MSDKGKDDKVTMQGTDMFEETESMEDRVREAEEITIEPDGLLTLSSGVKVKPKALPDLLILRVYQLHPEPTPPLVEVEASRGGTRMESNPNDPDYIAAVEHHAALVASKLLDVVMLRGLEVGELPDGVPPMEEDTWVDEAALLLGEDRDAILANAATRKLAWLQTWVVLTTKDFATIQDACFSLGGAVVDSEVKEALEQFRSKS